MFYFSIIIIIIINRCLQYYVCNSHLVTSYAHYSNTQILLQREKKNTDCSQTHSWLYFVHLQHCLRIKKPSAGGSSCFSIWSWIFHPVLRDLPISYSAIYETLVSPNRIKFHLMWHRSWLQQASLSKTMQLANT